MKATLLPLILLALFSCSENKAVLTENEQNYLQTQDSLAKYRSDILALSSEDTSEIIDFINLDYSAYKAKYHLSEKEMDIMRRTLNVRCEEVKAFKAIRQNMSHPISTHPEHSKDTSKGTYSFDRKLKPANVKEDASEEEQIGILRDAFEGKK